MNHPTEQIELTDSELAQVEGGWFKRFLQIAGGVIGLVLAIWN